MFAAGRWHSKGKRIVYTSSSLALATLELFVNLLDKHDLEGYVKTRISFDIDVVQRLEPTDLQAFLTNPDSFNSRAYGDAWLDANKSLVLEVPSRVVLEEVNYLFNPEHPNFATLEHTTTAYEVDSRLLK